MNENLRNQAVKAQQEQQRQAQQAADAKARADKERQDEERRREEERRKAQPGAYKPSQVDIDYRYVMDNLKRENERFDAARRSDPAKPEQTPGKEQGKESPAMQRYRAYEKAMAPKVEEYIRHSQSRAQGQEKAPGRDR